MHFMRVRKNRLAAVAFVLFAALLPLRAATTLVIRDADVRSAVVGSTVEVPVAATGITPAEFLGFQFDLDYDPAVLAFVGVTRGGLIDRQQPGAAVTDYAPYVWALESRSANGRVSVAGMLDTTHVDAHNLAGVSALRIPQADGVLLVLRFTLLARQAAPVTWGTTCLLVNDALTAASAPATQTPASRLNGGTITQGLPNWWQLEHFAATGIDPTDDPDQDGQTNEQEYLAGTNPRGADQTITFGSCPLPRKAIGQSPFALLATATSGLPVTFASSNHAVATVAGSMVTIVGPGTTTITASQAGNATWAAATDVRCDLDVAAVAADFVVTDIRLDPAVPAIGSTFTAVITVQNIGTKAGNGGFVYAWLDRPADAALGLAADKSASAGTLAPGQTKVLRLTSLKAGAAEGPRTFRAFVDAKNAVAEVSETNNQRALAWHAGRPDFVVTGVAFLPDPPGAGKTFTANVTVRNSGESAGDAGSVDVWTHAPVEVVAGLALRGIKAAVAGPMLPGQEKTLTFTSLAAAADDAPKTFRAVIDARTKTLESHEDNNQFTRTYQVGRPDFVITSVVFAPDPTVCGRTFTAYVTVKNVGAAAGDSVYVDVWAQRTAVAEASATLRGDKATATGVLAPAQEKRLTFSSLRCGVGEARVFRALVDSRAKVVESDDTNNERTVGYFCVPPP